MDGLIIFLLGLFLAWLIFWIVVWFIRWDGEIGGKTKMSFRQWVDIYTINPERWYLKRMDFFEFYYPIYRNNQHSGYYYMGDEISFGVLGNIKYRRWAIKKQKHRESSEALEYDNALIVKILNNAQLDIDEMKAKAQQEIDEARERIVKGVQDAGNLR